VRNSTYKELMRYRARGIEEDKNLSMDNIISMLLEKNKGVVSEGGK